MNRKIIDVAIIIPDASPVLTRGRIGRIDLLNSFAVPIRIVDQVHDEIIKPQNDLDGRVASALQQLHNHIEIVETNVGVGYRAGGRATRMSRAETWVKSRPMNMQRCRRKAAARASCLLSCLKTRTSWNSELRVSGPFTCLTQPLGS